MNFIYIYILYIYIKSQRHADYVRVGGCQGHLFYCVVLCFLGKCNRLCSHECALL